MSSKNYRLIQPAHHAASESPSSRVSHAEESHRIGGSRRVVTYAACTACRSRKSKCNGSRPTCSACVTRGTQCEYPLAEGQTRLMALKEDNRKLQRRLDDAMSVFGKLQGLPNSEAEQLFHKLRTGGDPAMISQNTSQSPSSGGSSRGGEQTPQNKLPDNLTTGDMDALTALVKGMAAPEKTFEWYEVSTGMRLAIPTASTFTLATAAFFGAIGHMYRPYTPEKARALLEELSEQGTATPETSLCEICAISCVGSRYSQMAIGPDLGSLFYFSALNLLHQVIDNHTFLGMKACCLLAIYVVLDKPIMAAGLLETSLAIGKAESVDRATGETTPDPFQAELNGNAKDWRTQVCFKVWLMVHHGFDMNSQRPEHLLDELEQNVGSDPDQVVQVQIAKITAIKCRHFLRLAKHGMTSDAVVRFQTALQEWFENLPAAITLSNLAEPDMEGQTRRLIYYTHLIHLSGLILLYRQTMTHYSSLAGPDGLSADPELAYQAFNIGAEGVIAAKQASRVLHLLLNEGALFKKSWLCVFTAYISSCVIMQSVFLKLLNGIPCAALQEDIEAAEKAVVVLEDCSRRDAAAREFFTIMKVYLSYLHDSIRTNVTSVTPATTYEQILQNHRHYQHNRPQQHDQSQGAGNFNGFLFTSPEGSEIVSAACRDLVKIICRPFAGIQGTNVPEHLGLLTISLEEVCLGIYLEWSLEPLPMKGVESVSIEKHRQVRLELAPRDFEAKHRELSDASEPVDHDMST